VYLPHRFEEPKGADVETARAVVRGTETILVIEDDQSVRTLARSVLARLGYSVLAAGDGNEAVTLAGAFDAGIHLLLCDVHLPGGSGYRAAERIRETRPDAKVMFMSGHMDLSIPDRERSATVTALQALDVFPKPFSVEQLAFAVRDALDSAVEATLPEGATAQ
jgi:CheY-like chemotaxis protein